VSGSAVSGAESWDLFLWFMFGFDLAQARRRNAEMVCCNSCMIFYIVAF
jgi:hypothetical protein